MPRAQVGPIGGHEGSIGGLRDEEYGERCPEELPAPVAKELRAHGDVEHNVRARHGRSQDVEARLRDAPARQPALHRVSADFLMS